MRSTTGIEFKKLIQKIPKLGKIKVKLPQEKQDYSFVLLGLGDEGFTSQLFWGGWDALEPESLPVWVQLAREAKVILDVGAYIGQMSLVAAAANRSARVYAFEPLPMAFDRLAIHQTLNSLNLEIFNLACSDESGELPFYFSHGALSPSNSLSKNFMEASERQGFAKNLVKKNVSVVKLDDWIVENKVGIVDLVKIDTEGTEPAVLRGMRNIIEKDRPDLVVECLETTHTRAEVEAILFPFGYQAYPLVSRTPRQLRINQDLMRWAGREESDTGTPNILFSARKRNMKQFFEDADRLSEMRHH